MLVRSVALNDCGVWALTKTMKIATFERIVVRRIFVSKINARGEFELKTNREIEELYGETNIIEVL